MDAEIRLNYGETRCFYERGTVYVVLRNTDHAITSEYCNLRLYQAQYDSITIVYDFIPLIYDGRYH